MPRPVAHLANLDLNLLVALRELLRERSVTRAAERLGVTQPAASAALARLRRHFADELLVRDRGEYTLTALGVQLAGQVDAVCAAAERRCRGRPATLPAAPAPGRRLPELWDPRGEAGQAATSRAIKATPTRTATVANATIRTTARVLMTSPQFQDFR